MSWTHKQDKSIKPVFNFKKSSKNWRRKKLRGKKVEKKEKKKGKRNGKLKKEIENKNKKRKEKIKNTTWRITEQLKQCDIFITNFSQPSKNYSLYWGHEWRS